MGEDGYQAVQDFLDEADAMGCSVYLVGKRVNGQYHVTVYDGARDYRTDGDSLQEAIEKNLALHDPEQAA